VPVVGPSDVAGQGLFADADLAAGAPVDLLAAPPATVADLGRLNHSCDPTLAWSGAGLAARRDVRAGEELTVDYATVVPDPALLLYCHCGTYRCRQVIEADDWRIPQLQERYAGQWAPELAARIAPA
jgi:hypothetical protein